MAQRRPRRSQNRPSGSAPAAPQASTVRIIGGHFRGRKLQYSGDPRVRPMKDRTREAIFNLLGPISAQQHAIDLFAGTGALGLEAISRGAGGATLIEYHQPTYLIVRENVESLEVEDRVQLIAANAFFWLRQNPSLPETPWIVFCSPPYSFYQSRWPELLQSLELLLQRAPSGSQIAVEAETSFDTGQLPDAASWLVRDYPPARIAVRDCT